MKDSNIENAMDMFHETESVDNVDTHYKIITSSEKKKNPSSYLVQHRKKTADIELDPPQYLTSYEMVKEIERRGNKPLIYRTFASFPPGGLRTSVFTLFSASVGAGVLSLPHVISYFGVYLGVSLMVFASLANYFSFLALNKAIRVSKKKGYANVCASILGKTTANIFIFMLILTLFLVCCIYSTLTWNFMEYLLVTYKFVQIPYVDKHKGTFQEYSQEAFKYRGMVLLVAFLALFPFLLQKKLTALRYVTLIILSTIAYTIVLTMIQTPKFHEYYKIMQHYDFSLYPPKPSLEWIPGIATIAMSYSCQPVFFYVRSELRHKSSKRVIAWTMVSECLLFVVVSLVGYYSLGGNRIPAVFTQRNPLPGMSDSPMTVARWIFVLVITLHIPIAFLPLREQIFTYFQIKRNKKNHVLVTFFVGFFVFLLPFVYPDVLALFGFVGGTVSSITCLIIPYMLGFRISNSKFIKTLYFLGIILFTYIGILVLYTSFLGV